MLMGAGKMLAIGGLSLVLIPLWGATLRSPSHESAALAPAATWDKIPNKCPGHLGNDSFPQLAVPGRITNIPEYHDCQRFVDYQKYDSLYAIFVSSSGQGLMDRLKRLECNASTRLANGAVPQKRASEGRISRLLQRRDTSVDVMNPSFTRSGAGNAVNCRAEAGSQWNLVAVAAAEILSWGGNYASLGIRPYFNCLFIYDSGALKAKMVPVGEDDSMCADVVDPTVLPGTELTVRATSRAGLLPEDYPPVGRWDTDSRTGRLYVGMICGDRWCEVAPEGTTYSEQRTSNSTDRLVRRLEEVKGWYDEQRLAEFRNGVLVPSRVHGRFMPYRDLGQYQTATFAAANWLRAGFVLLSEDHPKYKESLNLEAGPRLNRIFLCYGSEAKCIPPNARSQVEKCRDPTKKQMYARIQSSSNVNAYRCVGWYHHAGGPGTTLHIPGTVRWAWYDTDEGGWMRCPSGCCYPT
jgi:hypothetical protein